jgi:hypothetical protein
VLTARAENLIRGNPDLDDTITRMQAYKRAGADVHGARHEAGRDASALPMSDRQAGHRREVRFKPG